MFEQITTQQQWQQDSVQYSLDTKLFMHDKLSLWQHSQYHRCMQVMPSCQMHTGDSTHVCRQQSWILAGVATAFLAGGERVSTP